MAPQQRETFPPVALSRIRGHGCRGLLVYLRVHPSAAEVLAVRHFRFSATSRHEPSATE
jgi:hypothetical protein